MANNTFPSVPGRFACGAMLLLILILIALTQFGQDRNVWQGWTEGRSLRTMGSLFTLVDRFPTSRKTKVRWLVGSSAALVAGVICRQLDAAGRFSGPDSWFQGHALWHLLTALSLGCMYFFCRSESETHTCHNLAAPPAMI